MNFYLILQFLTHFIVFSQEKQYIIWHKKRHERLCLRDSFAKKSAYFIFCYGYRIQYKRNGKRIRQDTV